LTLLEALALGVLQGVTEFLPISSSGHLALAQTLLGRAPEGTLLFNVVVHLGTMVAIALVLWRRIARLCLALASFVRPGAPDPALATERTWIGLIIVANIPTGLIGLGIRDTVQQMNHAPRWIGVAYLGTALLLLAAERVGTRDRGPDQLGVVDALWIGCAQSLGILPGVSRSGATVTASLWRGARADTAVEFSILISIPAIVAANLLEMLGPRSGGPGVNVTPLAVGFVAALVTGVVALRVLQWVVRNRQLLPFAAYCALLGAVAVAIG
jgi:undecaprenyl-diphosphatase